MQKTLFLRLRTVDESSVFQILGISENALHHVLYFFFLLSLEHSLACEFNETRTGICGSLKYLWCDHLALLGLNLGSRRCYLLSPSVPIVTLWLSSCCWRPPRSGVKKQCCELGSCHSGSECFLTVLNETGCTSVVNFNAILAVDSKK